MDEVKSKETEKIELSYFFSYVVLLLFILATVISTTDEVLLLSNSGVALPLVDVEVSVLGFYLISPFIVLFAHLIISRKVSLACSTIRHIKPKSFLDYLDIVTDKLFLICLLGAGPMTVMLITLRFADYQHPVAFIVHILTLGFSIFTSVIRYRSILSSRKDTVSISGSCAFYFFIFVLTCWIFICIDVIYLPAKYSPMIWVKTNTYFLDDEDGGAKDWVPHIKIDRATKLWNNIDGPLNKNYALHAGYPDSLDFFMNRDLTLDLRSRNLRFLDIAQQILPRIWLHSADLSGANLSFSRLYGSIFVDTDLYGANLHLAALDGSNFMNMKIEAITLNHTSLRGTYWDNVEFINTTIAESDLFLASFYGTSFTDSVFSGGNLNSATFVASPIDNLHFINSDKFYIFEITSDNNEKKNGGIIKNNKKAVEIASRKLCVENLPVSFSYAWNTFVGLQVMAAISQPESVEAIRLMLNNEECSHLNDRGLKDINS